MFCEALKIGSIRKCESFVSMNVKKMQDFEINFKSCKQLGKEAESIPSVIKLVYFSISSS